MGALFGRTFAVLLCLAVSVWSVIPAVSHAPELIQTLHEHTEMVEEHGHSHGLLEDIAWAMHGHSHDTGDHDHSQAVLAFGQVAQHPATYPNVWRFYPVVMSPSHSHRIDRPPRA